MSIVLELTEKEREIVDEVLERLDNTAEYLAGLSHEERLNWLRAHQFYHPISFEREIDGTVYSVNAHFSDKNTETVEGKVMRILD